MTKSKLSLDQKPTPGCLSSINTAMPVPAVGKLEVLLGMWEEVRTERPNQQNQRDQDDPDIR